MDGELHVTEVVEHDVLRRSFPEDMEFFSRPSRDPAEMNILELESEIEERNRRGLSDSVYRVHYHGNLAFPVMCILVVIVGAYAGGRSGPRGSNPMVRSILLSSATIFLYQVAFRLSVSLGGNGVVPPELAGWGPTVLFAVLAFPLVYSSIRRF